MTAGRPIGDRIREVCATLEEIGPANCRDLVKMMPGVEYANMGNYCTRAVGLGFMTVAQGKRTAKNPNVYTVVPNWRDLVGERKVKRIKPMPVAKQGISTVWLGVSSVFGIAT